MEAGNFAKYFDHTLLRADATHADFRSFCADCARYGFAMAAVNPEALQGAFGWKRRACGGGNWFSARAKYCGYQGV